MSEIIRYKCPRGCKCYTRAGGDSGETPRCPNCDHRMIPAEDETSEGKMFPPIGMQKCGKCGGGITGNQGHTCPPVSELKACPECKQVVIDKYDCPECGYSMTIEDDLRAELEVAIADRTKMADERDAIVQFLREILPDGYVQEVWWCPVCDCEVEATHEENCFTCGLPLATINQWYSRIYTAIQKYQSTADAKQ